MTPAIRFDVLTIFPDMFGGPLAASLLGRARERGLVTVDVHDLRAWARGKHHVTDDYPYGGGPGMVMKAQPIVDAVDALRGSDGWTVLLSPQGIRFNQQAARRLASQPHIILVCGRYEGVDERVRSLAVDEEISLGDYVLSGGEIAALAIVDATVRLVPGFIGSEDSLSEESHTRGLLEYPQYTRPEFVGGLRVPELLLSGNHGRIQGWRRAHSIRRTLDRRPDMLKIGDIPDTDRALLREFGLDEPHADNELLSR